MVADAAAKAKISVTICGQMCSDPRFCSLFIGLGVERLSVTPQAIPEIKDLIRRITTRRAWEIAVRASEIGSGERDRPVPARRSEKTVGFVRRRGVALWASASNDRHVLDSVFANRVLVISTGVKFDWMSFATSRSGCGAASGRVCACGAFASCVFRSPRTSCVTDSRSSRPFRV